MISEAIQAKCVAVIPTSYYSMGDEKILAPYCVHRETGLPPITGKNGILEYPWHVEVAIIDKTPADVNDYAVEIREGIESLENTTSHGTDIQDVTFMGEDPDYDDEEKLYVTILQFTITTTNSN